jgi:hypothetical protein
MIVGIDSDAISDTGLLAIQNGSFSMLFDYEENPKNKNLKPPMTFGSNNSLTRHGYGTRNNGFYSTSKSSVYKYELEFQELQLILLWFVIIIIITIIIRNA